VDCTQLRRSTFTASYQLDDSVAQFEVTHVLRAVIAPSRTRRVPMLWPWCQVAKRGRGGRVEGSRGTGERREGETAAMLAVG
jgi:hypothetical protein